MTPHTIAEPELALVDPMPTARELASHPEALLAAFKGSNLWRPPIGMTFHEAIATPAIRTCLTTAAEIRARKLLERTAP